MPNLNPLFITAFLTFITAFLTFTVASYGDEPQQHDHMPGVAVTAQPGSTPLTAPGNAAFAAIQEAVQALLADPTTDWSKVNLEALRQHLQDMDNFTLHVNVSLQKPIGGGVEFSVQPTSAEAKGSLARLFKAHPAILKQESGWEMHVQEAEGTYTARVTSTKTADVAKIRGLGYIGIVALGAHHQLHHWQMATGINPHQHHH